MRKHLCTLLLLASTLVTPFVTRGQSLESYTFTTGTDTTLWIDIPSTDTSLITPGAGDYGVSSVQSLGFGFSLGEEVFSQFSVNADGNLRLGSIRTSTSGYTNPFNSSNANSNTPKINFFGCDGFCSNDHYVRYLHTVNAAGDSVGVVEFCMGTYNSNTRSSLYKWQVQLYHNGTVLVVYGAAPDTTPNVSRQVGLCMSAADGWTVSPSHVATHFTAGTSANIPTRTWPEAGRYYRFQPEATNCPSPFATAVSDLSPTGFTFSWTDTSSTTSWLMRLAVADTVIYENVVNYTTAWFTDMMPNTTYTVSVAGLCDAGDTSRFITTTVQTLCLAIDSLPYLYGFEDATTGGGSNPIFVDCWFRLNNATSYFGYPYVGGTTYAHSGSKGLYWFASTGTTYGDYMYVALPMVDANIYPINTLMLKFWAKTTSATSQPVLEVGVMTDPMDTSTFTLLQTISVAGFTDWTEFEAPLAAYTGTGAFVAIRAFRPSSTWTVYMDDFNLDLLPACPRPEGLTAANVTPSTADISWLAATGYEYEVEYGLTGFSQGTGTLATVYDTLAQLTELTPGTTYDVYVRSVCGDDSSSWSMIRFSTGCREILAEDLPYIETFESYGTGSANPISPCWTKYSNTSVNYPYPYTSAAINGSRGLYFYSYFNSSVRSYCYAVLPPVSTELPINTLMLQFMAKRYSTTTYYSKIIVGVAASADSAQLFTPVDTVDITNEASGSVHNFEVSFANYEDTGRYIVLYSPTPDSTHYNAIYIDDVQLRRIPSCYRPTQVAVTSLGADSANIVWTPDFRTPSPSAGFTVEYNPLGSDESMVMTTSTYDSTIRLDNLDPATTYEVNIYADCGDEISDPTTLTFRTACAYIPDDSLPYVENFDSYPAGTTISDGQTFDPCWVKGTNYTSDYPYVYTTNHHSAPNAMYFYATANYYSYIALPAFETDVNQLELSFNLLRTSANYGRMRVGVMANPYDMNTFHTLADVQPEEVGTWQRFILSFPDYEGPERYFAIMLPDSITAFAQVDDISVNRIASCPTPRSVRLASVSSTTATVAWDADSNATAWNVYYGAPGFDMDTVTLLSTDTNTYTLTGLQPQTEYEVIVVASCNGETGNGSYPLSFRTECNPIPTTSLPYVENFDSYTATTSANDGQGINPCWNKGTNNSTLYPYLYNNYYATSPNALRFFSNTTSYSYAALPMFESSLQNLRVNFDLIRSSSSYTGKLTVGVMTNPHDINSFTAIATCYPSAAPVNQPVSFEVPLDSYLGSEGYIAFLADNDSVNYTNLDNVVVSLLPACRRSADLVCSNVTASTADLAWSNSSSSTSGYIVAYSTTDDFDPDDTDNSTQILVANADTNITLTGLSDYTTYYWAVRALCGTDSSEWSSIASFRTLLDCGTNYVNIVDTIGQGTTSSYIYTFYAYSSYPSGYSRNIFTAQELAEMGIYSNNSINGISIHCGTTGGTINDVRIYLAETDLDEFGNPASSDTLSRANMSLVFQGNLDCAPRQWIDIPFDTAFSFTGTRNLMLLMARQGSASASVNFYYTSTTPAYRSTYGYLSSTSTGNPSCTRTYNRSNIIFNICSEIPACEWPTDIAVSDLMPTSATFTWQGNGLAFETALGVQGFNPDTVAALAGIHLTTDSNHITYTGLNSNTTYDFYARTYCSTGDTSQWSLVRTFRTPCTAAALPYTEDFESYTSGSSNPISPCWVKGTTSTVAYPYPYSTNAISGDLSLYFYASKTSSTSYYSYAALPLMSAPVDSLQLTFNMRRYSSTTTSYTSRLVVGLMTDPSDIETFTPVDTIDLHDAAPLSVSWVEVSFAGHLSDGQYIAIYNEAPPFYAGGTSAYSYVYVDDILVDYIPTCPAPLNLAAVDSTITTTSAQLSWTSRTPSATGYQIEYGPEGFAHGTGTLAYSTSTTVTLTGLTPGIAYDAYVRPICSAADTGVWSQGTNFITLCMPMASLPVSYDFEGLPTGTTSRFPICWNRINNGTTYGYFPYVNTGTSNTHSGNNHLYFYMSTTATTYGDYALAVLPEIDTLTYPANTLEVVFWGKGGSSTTYNNSITLGMMSDPEDQSTFVPVQTITMGSTYQEYHVSFANYTGNGSYPAFRKDRSTSTGYAYIDDVTLAQLSPCPRPYDMRAVSSTPTTATLAWSDTIGSNHWQITYIPMGSTTPSYADVLTNPATITGLTPATAYNFRVSAYCSDGTLGGVSLDEGAFSTTQIPDTVPVFYNFEDPAQWASWQTTSNTNINWYRGTAPYTDGQHAIYISADGGATRSTNMSSIVNACAYRDIDFGSTPRSCNVTFRINVGGSQAANYDGVAVLLVDPSTYVESSDTRLTTPWGHVNDTYLGMTRRTSGWQTVNVSLDNVSGIQRLVFYWFNQSTGADDFVGEPPAIDSIMIYDQPCARPFGLNVTALSENSADIAWIGPASGTTYIVAHRQVGQPASSNRYDTVSTNHATIYGLNANTEYNCWVQRICDAEHSSNYSNGLSFQTICGHFSAFDTISEGFEGLTATTYSGADGILPDCWEGYSSGTNQNYIPHVVGSGSYWYTVEGTNCVTMSSGSSTTVGNTKILRLPMTSEPINTLTLSYWMCTEGSTQGTLSVGYMTGTNYETDFVSIKDIPASTTTQHSGNGLQSNHGIFDTVHFDSVPATALYVAFRWYYNSTMYSVSLDNIELTSSVSCPAPVLLGTSQTYESIDVSWLAASDTFDVAITSGTWTNSIAPLATITSHNYSFTSLSPVTRYVVGVRQHCTDGINSLWATAVVVTDSLGCITPSNFNVSNITNATAQFDWNAIGDETNWNVHVWSSATLDSTYLCTTHPVTLGGLTAGVTYNASIQPLCGTSLIPGDWSDTLTFTTATCPNVTGLTVGDVTTNSVTLSWDNNPAANSWTIEYGYAGFNQGTGTTATVTEPTFTASGLECETQYEFYVKAVCGDDWTSENWSHANATTAECTQVCDAPYGIVTTVTGNSVDVSWIPSDGNTSFEIEYGTRGFSHGTGTLASTDQPRINLNGLDYNTQYDLYVRAICGTDNYSAWSVVSTFTTDALGIDGVQTLSCTIHPNPATSATTISVSGVNGKVKIEVVDINGRAVASETLECDTDCVKTLEVDHLAQGTYFVRITTDGTNMVRKLIVR